MASFNYLNLIQLAIGFVILLWLLQLADAPKILANISTANPVYVTAATLMYITSSTMIALSLYVSLKKMGIDTPIKDTILASFSGQLLSDITPARSGYFLTPFILNKMYETPIESSMAGVVATGLVNFFVKAVLSLIALAYFMNVFSLDPVIVNTLLTGISLLIAGSIGLLSIIWGRRLPRLLERIKKLPALGRPVSRVAEAVDNIQEEARKAYGSLILITLLRMLSIVLNGIALYFISNALWQGLPTLLDFILIVPLVTAFNFVPITIAGLGVQETSCVILLTFFGVPLEEAIAFTLVNRLLFTCTDIIGLPPLLKVGVEIRSIDRSIITRETRK